MPHPFFILYDFLRVVEGADPYGIYFYPINVT